MLLFWSGSARAASPIRINEVAPSETTDWIEFYVASGGDYSNLIAREGSTILQGSAENTAAGKTFPGSFNPQTGDYIVLHFANTTQVSEDDATGKGANNIWDIYTNDSGLTATDNIITLSNAADTAIIDAVAFANQNGSWTGNTSWFNNAVVAGQWTGIPGEGDSANWLGGSAGRSLGRDNESFDSDNAGAAKNDWNLFTAQTKGLQNPVPTALPPPPPSAGDDGTIAGAITEIAPGISGGDFIEIYIDAPSNIQGCKVYEGGSLIKTFQPATVKKGDFIVVWASKNGVDETDVTGDTNRNGYWDVYSEESSPGITNTDGSVTLIHANGEIVDFMTFAENDDMDYASTLQSGYNNAVSQNQWSPAASTEEEYVAGSFLWSKSTAKSMSRKKTTNNLPQDTNTKDDWAETSLTPGRGYGQQTITARGEILEIFQSPFSPYNDGKYSEAIIAYKPPPETTVTIAIYDDCGNIVKTLVSAEAQTISEQKTLRWGGTDSSGGIVEVGIYIIHMQVVDNSTGRVTRDSKTLCVARKLY